MKNMESDKSTIKIIVHSFFVVPFLIAAFGVLIFFIWSLLTYESKGIEEYIVDIKVGGSTKRWQSAFELSRLLSNPEKYPISNRFVNEMLSAYEYALLDPNVQVRQYLIRAMGQTKDSRFLQAIKSAITHKEENVVADAVYAISFYNNKLNVDLISSLISHNSSLVRNRVAVALGEMITTSETFLLKNLLKDEEPNVRWNAAISLAKHGDSSGKNEILNLLDRQYLNKFESIDRFEKEKAMMVAVKISNMINDKDVNDAVLLISKHDENLKLRNVAINVLKL